MASISTESMVTLTCPAHDNIADIKVTAAHAVRMFRHPKNSWKPKTKTDADTIAKHQGQTEGTEAEK